MVFVGMVEISTERDLSVSKHRFAPVLRRIQFPIFQLCSVTEISLISGLESEEEWQTTPDLTLFILDNYDVEDPSESEEFATTKHKDSGTEQGKVVMGHEFFTDG